MDPNSFDDLLKIQRMMASKIIDESTMDAKIKLLDLINGMVSGKNKQIAIEHIILEAQSEGFQEGEILRMLEELKSDELVQDKGNGFILLLR